MATIVFGGGVSHTPLLTLEASQWKMRGEADKRNPGLNLSDGRFVSYEALVAEVGEKYAEIATTEVFEKKAAICQAALDRFSHDMMATRPDVIIVIGDDHMDMFSMENMPAVSIYYGEKIVTKAHENFDSEPDWVKSIMLGYAQDKRHVLPGSRSFALDLIRRLSNSGVDIAASSHVPTETKMGLGHSYGFVAKRIMPTDLPMVPFQLNTYYPPNVPSAARCFTIGRALRQAVEESAIDMRVAIVASGGLSHFVVDETLDRSVMDDFMSVSSEALSRLPRLALNSGSSEILNWVLAAGAIDFMEPRWYEYQPIYRTPAGTGVGIGVAARW